METDIDNHFYIVTSQNMSEEMLEIKTNKSARQHSQQLLIIMNKAQNSETAGLEQRINRITRHPTIQLCSAMTEPVGPVTLALTAGTMSLP